MASFVALNVEPEDDSEEEIDNTKEIQIEEALKLYQSALKLHSQGPAFYDEADSAYDALFDSEIFNYYEALSESKRHELYGYSLPTDQETTEESLNLQSALPAASSDGSPSTLPQLLHLSYKNHGQFLLDRLTHELSLTGNQALYQDPATTSLDPQILITAIDSLDLFTEALERDDNDSDLWRRTSRISGLIGSQRIARFCLEAILRVSGRDSNPWLQADGLDETFAAEDLRDLIIGLQDKLSESQLPNFLQDRKKIPPILRKVMDACPRLPATSYHVDLRSLPSCRNVQLSVPFRTWTSVGQTILQHITRELQGDIEQGFGVSYYISLPGDDILPVDIPTQNAYPNDILSTQNLGTTSLAHTAQRPMHTSSDTTIGVAASSSPAIDTIIVNDNADVVQEDDHTADVHVETPELNLIATVADGAAEQGTAVVGQLEQTNVPFDLPTRKRTLETTGLPENGENGRVRSKRIRARAETLPDEETETVDLVRHYEDLLQDYIQADHWLNGIIQGTTSKLGMPQSKVAGLLRSILTLGDSQEISKAPGEESAMLTAILDFKETLSSWDLNNSTLLLRRNNAEDSMSAMVGGNDSTFATFLEYSRPGLHKPTSQQSLSGDTDLSEFCRNINQSWATLDDVATEWLFSLIQPQCNESVVALGPSKTPVSKYLEYAWPDALKEVVVGVLISQDSHIYQTLQKSLESSDRCALHVPRTGQSDSPYIDLTRLLDLVQTIFELHLDIYGRITNPSSKIDDSTRAAQRDRLKRWAGLLSLIVDRCALNSALAPMKLISFRYLWSSTLYVSLIDPISRDHVLLCLRDLKTTFEEEGSPVFELQNNAIMPELSVEAVEREITKLTTMDFFAKIFDSTKQDPLILIESLEPILIGTNARDGSPYSDRSRLQSSIQNSVAEALQSDSGIEVGENSELAQFSSHMTQMAEFLDKATVSLRLFLWRRLRTAYDAIDYPPMTFLCSMRSIQLILEELKGPVYINEIREDRMIRLVQWLGSLDDLLIRVLRLALDSPSAFDCLDESNLRISLLVCVDLTQLLQVFVLWEDSVRVGHSQAPSHPGGPASTAYKVAMNQFREMHVKAWMLQYLVFKEAMSQNASFFPTLKEDLADYLKMLHHALGLRGYCKLSKKLFLKFTKTELFSLQASEDWELDMAQIIFDLYGLKVCPNNTVLVDHGCTPENLDRVSAHELVDFVMKQAERTNIKDLLKTDLKLVIDKMQGMLGAPNPKSLMFNRRIINTYLKQPINPLDMYRCLRGIGSLSGISVLTEHALLAKKRWYYLLGYMTFAKFRSQKRVSPTPTDELDIAIIFFRHDLEFDTEKWETWYRLAQVYDAKIEEDTTWNADKLNSHMDDLVVLQRNAIRCYMMAVAVAVRLADASFETVSKISDLYTDFGNRIYASSREPFSMAAFGLENHKRFCNDLRGTYERLPFRPLHTRQAWIFASVLYRQALIDKPELWINWYMLGKCLWKIHCSPVTPDSQAGFQDTLEAYTKAIQCVPEKKDSRHLDRDPILEPHYKLVSFVHKLVQRRHIFPEDGCRFLDATPYTAKIPHIQDPDDWESYILSVLKSLRAADKANWHHRIVARAAHVIYDDSSADIMAAHGARHELTQQTFTKTMNIQVWKPEYERAGRHFVYTRRYVKFFVMLLQQLNDRPSIESLGRRVRKKPGDFLDHPSVWSDVCLAHLKLLRVQGAIPEGHEDTIFKSMAAEMFNLNTARLEAWAHLPATSVQAIPAGKLLEILRETVELKKTNANLMKSTLIDDLIGDIFARVYEIVVPDLMAKFYDEENRDRMRVDHLLMSSEPPPVEISIPAPSVQGTDQPTARTRSKAVSRRDVGRKAEALIAKQIAVPVANKPKLPTSGSVSMTPVNTGVAVGIEQVGDNKEDSGVRDIPSSAAGSVHDSADDESELSDIIEEEEEEKPIPAPKKPLFPGLMTRNEDEDTDATEDVVEEDLSDGDGGRQGADRAATREGSVLEQEISGAGNGT